MLSRRTLCAAKDAKSMGIEKTYWKSTKALDAKKDAIVDMRIVLGNSKKMATLVTT